MRNNWDAILAVAIILGAARFSFAQDASVAVQADLQNSDEELSADGAGGNAGSYLGSCSPPAPLEPNLDSKVKRPVNTRSENLEQ